MNNSQSSSSLPVRIFKFIGRSITVLRNLVLNLIFLFFVAVILVAIFSQDHEPIPERAPLYISVSGLLVDQYTYLAPQDRLLGSEEAEMRVRDLTEVIRFAGNDNRISGLILDLDDFRGGGMSKVLELGLAIDRFKDSGKPVIALSDNYDQQQYLLATYADEIYMHSLGRVAITGFSLYRNYYKDALDKLAVDFHVFKVGKFKDFVEPYIRNGMSEESRTHNFLWINTLWTLYTEQVETRRELAEGTLDQWINHMDDRLAEAGGNIAAMAKELHLVDHAISRVARKQRLIEQFGHIQKQPDRLNAVSYGRYQHEVFGRGRSNSDAQIALVVARGNILDGDQPEGTIGGDTLANTLREVYQDDDIQALVFRIDSGGGSAFASEIIREQLQALRDKGVKIVVSMGSVAASGGYWIASSSDQIWATPATITGSIGVFGLFPTLDKSLDKIGVHTDGFGTTKLAGSLRLDRPLNEQTANILQQGVENIYEQFLTLVAANRNSTPEAIHEVAQGRVWAAPQAHELGLVDQLGYLDDAIAAAAELAGISNREVKLFERELSPQEQLIQQIMEEASIALPAQSWLSQISGIDLSTLEIFFDAAQRGREEPLKAVNHVYASCLSCIAP